MGLNDEYKNVRENILMMNPLPNLSQAYRLILQEKGKESAILVFQSIRIPLLLLYLIIELINFQTLDSIRELNHLMLILHQILVSQVVFGISQVVKGQSRTLPNV